MAGVEGGLTVIWYSPEILLAESCGVQVRESPCRLRDIVNSFEAPAKDCGSWAVRQGLLVLSGLLGQGPGREGYAHGGLFTECVVRS